MFFSRAYSRVSNDHIFGHIHKFSTENIIGVKGVNVKIKTSKNFHINSVTGS